MSDSFPPNPNLSPERRKLFEALLREEGLVSSSERINRRKDSGTIPLSFAQERLWFLDQLVPGNPAYNVCAGVRVGGPLDTLVLENSINEIIRRHEILRTSFVKNDGRPVQIIRPELRITVQSMDLRGAAESEREAWALRLANEEARKPFDLSRAPLQRVHLFRLREQEYVLLLVIHHIIAEVWSLRVFFQELALIYEAFSAEKPSPLPELSLQYADFAAWQRQCLQGNALNDELSYWKRQLNAIPPPLQLPYDSPRPATQTFAGATKSLILPQSLHSQLKLLCQREGLTLFMTLLAAFATLLSRYAHQEDILIGSPVAGRNRVELEGLIGFFINTLALRVDLSGNPSFFGLLRRVREMTTEAYANQELPFEKLVEVLQPARDLSHSPLFQVALLLQNASESIQQLPSLGRDLTLSPFHGALDIHSGTSKFDLTLIVWEEKDGLTASLEYNTDLFNERTMDRMLGHLRILLESAVANPGERVGILGLLTAAERHRLLAEWNETERDYPRDCCIHELFEAEAERTPEGVAVVFGGDRLTYGELNRRANRLAHYLRKLNVGPEVVVAICMERSLEMIVGLLGILKAGAAYLPLDPGYPKERLAYMIGDAGVDVLLTQARLIATLGVHGVRVVCLDGDWGRIDSERDDNPINGAAPENLAYVIYTSGSTGKPKGVAVAHRGLLNLVFWHRHAFAVTPSDRATQLASAAFDASVWEIWPYLTAGAKIYLGPPEVAASSAQLRDWLIAHDITISFLPTPLAERVLLLDWPDNAALRIMLTGGDKLRHFPSASLPFELVNNYGPTENAVVTTYGSVLTGGVADAVPSIGRPITNVKVYILDRHLEPVPVGVAGELYIAGESLARGYLGRADLTAERFVPDPFGREPGRRMYRTGDLVRYLFDGSIEFLGRIDQQVKIRGFRIELGEVEAALAQHSVVREAVVVAREDERGENRLIAYVVGQGARALGIGELRGFLGETLPEYMVPAAFMFLDSLPLTENGKVDRRALPLPDKSRPELENAFVSPRGPVEEALAAIWAEVLQVEKVGVHDNFFDLGGHSLLLAQVHAKLIEALAPDLSMIELFRYPTISALAQYVGREQSESTSLAQSQERAKTRQQFMERRMQLRKKGLMDNEEELT